MSTEFKFSVMDANQNIEAQQNVVRELVTGKLNLKEFIHRIQPQKHNGS
jgi:hypothetical protein